MKFIITIDTEADNQWKRGNITTTENIDYISRFQNLCNRYNLKPTYLCTYEVVESQQFAEILNRYQRQGIAEIGAHLHPWTNPPFEDDSPIDLYSRPYPSELSLELFYRKMEALTDLIYSKSGLKPTTYRAGRWGFSASHIPVLLDLGYKVDCSVTPLVSWKRVVGIKEGGPDFRGAPVEPYYLDFGDACLRGESRLLEVPVTILFTNRVVRNNRYLWNLFLNYGGTLPWGVLSRIIRSRLYWFRPFPHMTAENLKAVYSAALKQKLPVIELMFRSSELMPGGSPYNPDKDSVERLYLRLEKLFQYLKLNQVQGETLFDFHKGWTSRDYRGSRSIL